MRADAARPRLPGHRSSPVYAWTVSLAMIAAVASPALRGPDYDAFPWSSYPMFARPVPREATVLHALVLAADGRRQRPAPPRALGTDEVLQAAQTLGGGEAPALCRRIAGHLAADPEWRAYEWVEIASDTYDVIDYFTGDRRPRSRDIHTRCRIRR